MGVDLQRSAAAGGRLRRRALDRGRCAQRIEERERASRPTTSTACPRSSAPGVGIECCGTGGPAHLRGPLLPGDHRPRDAATPLPDGEEGELVLTTLSKQAMPMIRYRTRDITSIIPEPCACGRTIRRIRRIGRAQRRHVHHPRRQRLPLADRGGAADGGGHPAPLPDRPDAREGPRPDGSAGRGDAGDLQRHRCGALRGSCQTSTARPTVDRARPSAGIRANGQRSSSRRPSERSEGKAKRGSSTDRQLGARGPHR